jgi:hypothetical protein
VQSEFPITFDDRARIRSWNALHALNLTHCDAGVTSYGKPPKDAKNGREKMLAQVKLDPTRAHFLGRDRSDQSALAFDIEILGALR